MTNIHAVCIEGDNETGYCAFFPRVIGCTSAGSTINECFDNAIEAWNFHHESLPYEDSHFVESVDDTLRIISGYDDEAKQGIVAILFVDMDSK